MIIDSFKIELMLADIGMTRADCSKRAGISRQNFSKILKRGTCLEATAGKIAKALGVPVSEIAKDRRLMGQEKK